MKIERQWIPFRIAPDMVSDSAGRTIFACLLKGLLGRRNGMQIGDYPVGSLVILGWDVNCDQHRLRMEVADASILRCPFLTKEQNDELLGRSHPLVDWSILEPYLDLTPGPMDSADAGSSGR